MQIDDRYHLMSNLAEAVEREVQQLQVQARAETGREYRGKAIRKSDADRSASAKMPRSTIREVLFMKYALVSSCATCRRDGNVYHPRHYRESCTEECRPNNGNYTEGMVNRGNQTT